MKLNYSLDDMRLFWVVAQQGSFKLAAQHLGIPPSTLSRRINLLEQSLGLRLLHRDAHRVNLTATGQRYLERCGPLFIELNQVSGELHADKHQAVGKLRISAPINTTYRWLGESLNAFQRHYPNIDIDLSLSNMNIDVSENAIDIAFRVGEPKDPDWIARPLTTISFVLCASSSATQWHTLHAIEALEQHPVIIAKPVKTWRLQHNITGQDFEFEPRGNIKLAVDDMAIASQAVVAGLGIGLLPISMASEQIQSGKLVQILPEWQGIPRTAYLMYRDRDNLPLRVRLLIDFMLANPPEAY